MKPLFVSIIALLLASTAAAQSTRVDTIAEEQAEKAKELGPEGPSDAERIIRRVLLSPLLSGGDGVYPWFGSVYGGSGMGLGVGFLKRLENASYVNLQTGISINTSMVIRGTFAAPEIVARHVADGCEHRSGSMRTTCRSMDSGRTRARRRATVTTSTRFELSANLTLEADAARVR